MRIVATVARVVKHKADDRRSGRTPGVEHDQIGARRAGHEISSDGFRVDRSVWPRQQLGKSTLRKPISADSVCGIFAAGTCRYPGRIAAANLHKRSFSS